MKLTSGVDMKLSTNGHGSVSIVMRKDNVIKDAFPIGIKGLVKLLMVFRGMSEKEHLSCDLLLEHKYDKDRSFYWLDYACISFYSIEQWEAFAFMTAAEQLLGEVVLCS